MATFTPGELEIMQVLWSSGALKPGEIQEKFPRPIRNAALRSALLVLLEKGHIKREKNGKAYFYSAKTPRNGAFDGMARRLAEAFWGGSEAAMIAHLIKSEELSDEDIRELRNIVEKAAASKTAPERKGRS